MCVCMYCIYVYMSVTHCMYVCVYVCTVYMYIYVSNALCLPSRIPAEGKVLIKKILLECLAEPSNQITRQMGELISKIIRAEGSNDWPELLPHLVDNIRNGSGLLQERSLYFLYRILKTMASKRLSEDIDIFRDVSIM